jgi:expansin (peptidoglycan-binding protein)
MNTGYLLATINAFYLVQNNPSASTAYILTKLYETAVETALKLGPDGVQYIPRLVDMAKHLPD